MYPISDACLAALRSDHVRTPVLEVFDLGFGALAAATYAEPTLQVIGGSISADRKADHTRSFTCQLVDEAGALVPTTEQTYVDPLRRQQLVVSFDITAAFGTERIPAGIYIIESCEAEEGPGGNLLTLSGRSRSVLIAENPWTGPYPVATGQTYSQAIYAILLDRAPAAWLLDFRAEASAVNIPEGMVLNGDPWAAAKKLAEADGKELVDDASGAIILRTIPNARAIGSSVASYDDSAESFGLIGYRRSIKTADVYNGVTVKGTAPWLLYDVSGNAWDTDPDSPTYVGGPLGHRPFLIEDAHVADQTQADAAAAAKLPDYLGVAEEVTFPALPNPAHDPGDCVLLGSSTLKLDPDFAILDSFNIDFDVSNPMSGVVRRQRNA